MFSTLKSNANQPKEESMFVIKKSQQIAFEKSQMEKFEEECLAFLKINFPDTIGLEVEGRQLDLIRKVTNFCLKYDIKGGAYIQKMLAIQIRYNYFQYKPMSKVLMQILTFEDREEDEKVATFHKQIIYQHKKQSDAQQ